MDESDDDIEILEEIKADSRSKRWKWKAPNPTVPVGGTQKILENVRTRLRMNDSPAFLIGTDKTVQVVSGTDKCQAETSSEKRHIPNACLDLETTPKKASSVRPTLSLTPEQIAELTDNCLDSDNEPTEAFKEPSQFRPSTQTPQSGPKRVLQLGVKVSNSVRYKASRYFGAGTSSEEVDKIVDEAMGLEVRKESPSKSPSPKKKRLSKNSPIRLLPSHARLGKSPKRQIGSNISPGRKNLNSLSPGKRDLSFASPGKRNPDSKGLSDSSNDVNIEGEVISEGPYYYEAFCFMVKKIYNNDKYKHLFHESELKKMGEIDKSKAEFQLYVRLMNRKDKWNRCCDISYNDISSDLSPLFNFLKTHELISCDLSDEKIDVLLNLLKKDELRNICSQFKVKKSGTKPELVEALCAMCRTQSTISGTNPLRECVISLLGQCVRLTVKWRLVFRRCILLFSMFHSYEDLDKLCSEQALLLLQVKLGNMVYPLNDHCIDQSSQIFHHRDQLIRFEEANELKQDINKAKEVKNYKEVVELTKKCVKQFTTLLELTSETTYVRQLPSFLQRYSAGSTYARTLTHVVDALKQDQKYDLAFDVLKLLMNQREYCTHLRGDWALKLSTLLHVNLKDIVKACEVLCEALRMGSLSPVDRMHLQLRAEKVYKLKKNGLPKSYKDLLGKVMDRPSQPPDIVEISARAMSGSKTGLKKVYIRDTPDGKEFMSVEETVIAHYRSLGFSHGVHDEGSTISSLCLLSLWDFIYDPKIPSVFQSPYQVKPLDWGSKSFYERRKSAIESHFMSLQSQDVASLCEELSDLRSKYCHITCLVSWDRLERLNILTFLRSITIPVFVAISRRLIEDWKSHRKGFPDLILWNPNLEKCLFIEVKSPNDTLSTVQSMWLHFLKNCGAQAFVAHIKESGSKVSK